MKILNKFIWSKKEPSNKNDIWFDGSTWRMYTEEAWQSFTLPVDAADKVAKVIENASEVYQEKLNAGYGIIIEGNTISVDDSNVWEAIETLQQNKVEQIQLNDYVPLDRYASTSQVLMDNISELASTKLNKTDVATINGQSLIEGGNIVIEGGDSSHNIGSIDLFEQIIAQQQNYDLTQEDKEAILNGKVITTSVGNGTVPTIGINSIEGLGLMLMFRFNERLYSMCVMWNNDRCYINGFFSFSRYAKFFADEELSETSENAVQNKVVTVKLKETDTAIKTKLEGEKVGTTEPTEDFEISAEIEAKLAELSDEIDAGKLLASFTRAYVTGTQDNLIVIDTTAKTVSFPLPSGTLILSEKHSLRNPNNTEALDASALGNNYFILFDFIANKFILAPVNFADDPAYKDCGVVAAVSASQKRVPYINADSYIFNGVSYKKVVEEVKETNDVYGNAFIKKGYFVWSDSGDIATTSNPSATTDFLDIKGVEQIIVKGRSGSAVALVAFYDESKTFISSIFGNKYSNKLITITSVEIPANAHYMVATGVGDGTDFLQITSLNDLYMRLQNMEKSTQPINISAILTMGASLMYNGNGWVEDGCGILGVTPYNKAASGVGVPSYFADLIWRNAYCTDEEFENADILAIQFASSTNMYIENNTKSIEDYESALDTSAANPFDSLSHAECLDYILKKWQKKCYEQKDNPNSKWYGTQYGKPCSLLFVTHWHDGRTTYNETIRQVAAKWGGCVCEFDKKIGFSKNQTLPDGRQPSIIYAVDTQVLDGVTYGWHPLRGDAGKKYIQRKMANIFADTIKECYSLYL